VAPVLTQGQLDRQLRAKKWLPDTRAFGNWLEKGSLVTAGLKEKRATKALKDKRKYAKIEEAAARHEARAKKSRRGFEAPAVQDPAWWFMAAEADERNAVAAAANAAAASAAPAASAGVGHILS